MHHHYHTSCPRCLTQEPGPILTWKCPPQKNNSQYQEVINANDPSAISPTETLLRLLLPLSDNIHETFQRNVQKLSTASLRIIHRIAQSLRATGGVYKGRDVMIANWWLEFIRITFSKKSLQTLKMKLFEIQDAFKSKSLCVHVSLSWGKPKEIHFVILSSRSWIETARESLQRVS